MVNPWIEHVKAYAVKHGVSYKEAMSAARASYKPAAGAKKPADAKGCKMGAQNRCVSYDGPNRDGCMRGPKGKCRDEKSLAKAYAPKREPTAAQLSNLAKARAARAVKKQAGGYWW